MLAGVEALAGRALAFSGVASTLLLLASLRVFFAVEGAADALWGAIQPRPFLRRLGLAALVVLAGPVGFGVVMSLLLEAGADVTDFRVTGVLASMALFTVLYRVVPTAHVRWGPAAAAGVVAGLGITLLRAAFTAGVVALAGIHALYGPIGAIVVFVVASGFSWAILLFGVALAHAVQFRDELIAHDTEEREAESAGVLEEAVSLLLVLAEAWLSRSGPVPLSDLSRETGLTEADAKARLRKAVGAGLASFEGDTSYLLTRAPETISLYAVARAVGETTPRSVPAGEDATAEMLRRLYRRADREERGVLQGISLRDILEPAGGGEGRRSPLLRAKDVSQSGPFRAPFDERGPSG